MSLFLDIEMTLISQIQLLIVTACVMFVGVVLADTIWEHMIYVVVHQAWHRASILIDKASLLLMHIIIQGWFHLVLTDATILLITFGWQFTLIYWVKLCVWITYLD